MSERTSDLTILGGGPAGLGVAFYAQAARIPYVLFEKSAALGGLCRTLCCGPHRYDTGAHRFHDRDPDVTADVRRLLGGALHPVGAQSQIYDRGRFIDFPPTPLNVLFSSGAREAGRIGVELLRARWQRTEPTSFADFAVRQFGATLARRLLLSHSEKVWGLPADQLSPDVATRRLQGMTLTSLFFELLRPSRKSAHIDGEFLYPNDGYGEIVERLRETLSPSALHTGSEVVRLECRNGLVARICFADGPPTETSGRIVSTVPLSLLVRFLGENLPDAVHRAAGALRFRHIRLFFLRIARPRVSSNASIYFPDPALCISRVYEPKNRSAAMAPAEETSLVVEVPCFAGDALFATAVEDLARRVIGELEGSGLIGPGDVVEWRHHFLANAYPVYSLDFSTHVRAVLDGLGAIANLDTLGRAGRFFYSHLHDQLRAAKDYVAAAACGGDRLGRAKRAHQVAI
jgi:protoporphyrinogen oxidase